MLVVSRGEELANSDFFQYKNIRGRHFKLRPSTRVPHRLPEIILERIEQELDSRIQNQASPTPSEAAAEQEVTTKKLPKAS